MSEARYKNTFAHDSFLGWLNIFKFKNTAHVLRPGERPPYPIIIADPTLSDVLALPILGREQPQQSRSKLVFDNQHSRVLLRKAVNGVAVHD